MPRSRSRDWCSDHSSFGHIRTDCCLLVSVVAMFNFRFFFLNVAMDTSNRDSRCLLLAILSLLAFVQHVLTVHHTCWPLTSSTFLVVPVSCFLSFKSGTDINPSAAKAAVATGEKNGAAVNVVLTDLVRGLCQLSIFWQTNRVLLEKAPSLTNKYNDFIQQ